MKLHNEGKTNKQIVEIIKSKGIKRRNKNDDYSIKDVWVCIKKMKKRNERSKKNEYNLEKWELWKEF